MKLSRMIRGWGYALLPSWSSSLHAKKRKGLFYRHSETGVLVCQVEQDRIFWEKFLHPSGGGSFLELGTGDGVVGSHTLGLELRHGWRGLICPGRGLAGRRAAATRACTVAESGPVPPFPAVVDLLVIHRPEEHGEIWNRILSKELRPRWVIVENADPNPSWARRLERRGYLFRWFFHDDEYFECPDPRRPGKE